MVPEPGAAAAASASAAAAAAEDSATASAAGSGDGQTPVVSLKAYTENLRRAMQVAQESLVTPGSGAVVWVKTTGVVDEVHNSKGMPWNRHAANVAAYNAAADAVCAELHVGCIDLHAFTAAKGAAVFRDHVHYTEEVEQEQAAFIFEQLAPFMQEAAHG